LAAELSPPPHHPARTSRSAADRVLLAQGRQSSKLLYDQLERAGIPVALAGDSKQVGWIGDAVHMAYRSVLALQAQFGPTTPAAC